MDPDNLQPGDVPHLRFQRQIAIFQDEGQGSTNGLLTQGTPGGRAPTLEAIVAFFSQI